MKQMYDFEYCQNPSIDIDINILTKAINLIIEKETNIFNVEYLNTIKTIKMIYNNDQIFFYFNNREIGYLLLKNHNILHLFHAETRDKMFTIEIK